MSSEQKQSLEHCKLILNTDAVGAWQCQIYVAQEAAKQEGKELDAQGAKKVFEHIMDEYGKARIDCLTFAVFARFGTHTKDFKTAGLLQYWEPGHDWWKRYPSFEKFFQAGGDIAQVFLDLCRKKNIAFLADLRMNDTHLPFSLTSKVYREHPEWHLEGVPGAFDYKQKGVRNAMLAFIKECLDKYDVDGMEFDYLRGGILFQSSEAVKNAPLLTNFTRKARQLLDEAAIKRGRDRLILGVRVPQTIQECDVLGFDVAAWIQEGFLDYVIPSDFFYPDFNARTEDFVKLTEGTDCKIYPAVHPCVAQGDDHQALSAANYRAAAKNFYAYGAEGISAYNYQYAWRAMMLGPGDIGEVDGWPKALGYLTQLREPETIGAADRHYLYHPLWTDPSPTGAVKNDRIVLDRTNTSPEGTFRFRMAEDLTDSDLSAALEFKVTGMVEGDELQVSINGQELPAERINRDFVAEGQSAHQGKPLPAFYLYRIELSSPPTCFGDNQLGVQLTKSVGHEELDIQEVEVKVVVKTP